MSVHDKKTGEKGFKHPLPLTFSHFNSSFVESETHFTGEKLSHSRDGLCFQTSDALDPGTTILIKLGKRSATSLKPETWEDIRTISVAKVESCDPAGDKHTSRYIVGVKYYDPAC